MVLCGGFNHFAHQSCISWRFLLLMIDDTLLTALQQLGASPRLHMTRLFWKERRRVWIPRLSSQATAATATCGGYMYLFFDNMDGRNSIDYGSNNSREALFSRARVLIKASMGVLMRCICLLVLRWVVEEHDSGR